MKKTELGQVLIEALVALGAAVVIVGAITIIVVTSLSNAELAKDQNQATQYAQQGMEVMREFSETNWANFISFQSTDYCLDQGSSDLVHLIGNYPNICRWTNDIFARQITIYHGSDARNDCLGNGSKVIVTVFWSDSKCAITTQPGDTSPERLYCHEVKLTSCFSNINAQPTI